MTEIAGTEIQPSRPSPAWLRILALLYDPFLRWGEHAGMRGRRSMLLHGAVGRVVEVGAGTGLNVEHYPDGIAELVLAEPDPAMRRRLARRVRRHARAAQVVDWRAERLPLPDASVDSLVSTLVLCTLDEPERSLREIARVLRPDRQLLLIEHVRASSRLLAACLAEAPTPSVTHIVWPCGCVCQAVRAPGVKCTAAAATGDSSLAAAIVSMHESLLYILGAGLPLEAPAPDQSPSCARLRPLPLEPERRKASGWTVAIAATLDYGTHSPPRSANTRRRRVPRRRRRGWRRR